jgi:thiamine monophosphate kinase
MKRLVLVVLVAVVVLGIFAYSHKNKVITTPLLHRFQSLTQETHEAVRIIVISGHEFDLTLTDGRRVYAKLQVQTPQEAKHKVVAYINQSKNPVVVVYEKGNEWTVDLVFESGSLTNWLRTQQLVWEN